MVFKLPRKKSGSSCGASARRLFAAAVAVFVLAVLNFAQNPATLRVGEKLSYSVSFEKFTNVGYFETAVVSQGKLGGKDVVEIRVRAKTYEFVSAAFSLLDEERTVFAAPDSLLPVFITRTLSDGVVPKVTEFNYLKAPATSFDLVTLIFKLREAGGNGSFQLSENGETFVVTAQTSKGKNKVKTEKVKTEAGVFDTVISTLKSALFDGRGITGLTINFTLEGGNIPVLIRFNTPKGAYRVELSGVTMNVPVPTPVSTPSPAQSPLPSPTRKPVAMPTPFIENQPLLPELAFVLGETLEYKVSSGGKPAAILTLQAKERKLFNAVDSLLLSAKITGIEQGNQTFALGDAITTQVDPNTLAPFQYDAKFGAALSTLNILAKFDQRTGAVAFGAKTAVEAPVGTHSILSLLYAMRSFNLKPSRDLTNPVNDTRVAVFWNDRPYIFTLRPGAPETISIGGEKVSVQLVNVITGNPQLDALELKIWLSTDDRRVPLRITAGSFQADLVTISVVRPQ